MTNMSTNMSTDTRYHFTPEDISSARGRLHFLLSTIPLDTHPEDREPLADHQDQWANALFPLDERNRLDGILTLLAACPNGEWIDRGIDKAIDYVRQKDSMNYLMLTGSMLRNLYWLHSHKEPADLSYYYTTLSTMAYFQVLWNFLVTTRHPGPGTAVYFAWSLRP